MGKYVVRSKTKFRELNAIKEEIKQLLLDGSKNEDVIEEYLPVILEKFSDYKESYIIDTSQVNLYDEYITKKTIIDFFKDKIFIVDPNKEKYFASQVPYEKGNEVCSTIARKLEEKGFLSFKVFKEKAEEDDNILKEVIENKLYKELNEIGKSSRMKKLFKEFGDIDHLIEYVGYEIEVDVDLDINVGNIFDLDLDGIIDLETVYGNKLDSLLDVVNKKFLNYEYQSISGDESEESYDSEEHEKYRKKLLSLGAKTKYEIIFEQAKKEKAVLANKILKRSLSEIYDFTNQLDDEKLLELYYIVITLLQAESPKVLKQVVEKINDVIFEGIFNVKGRKITNFTSYFFTEDKYHMVKPDPLYSLMMDQTYGLNYASFNEIYLPKLEAPYIYDFEFISCNTKKIDSNVIKFLIGNEGMKDFLFNYFDAIEFLKVVENYSNITKLKEYFIGRFFFDKENKFLMRTDILDRNIYNLYIGTSNKESKSWFIEAFKKLQTKEKLKFLSHRDYLGRNTLHYAFLKKDIEMLEVVSELYDDEDNQKELNRIAEETDYFNSLPSEYNKIKKLEINKNLILNEEKKSRGSFSFLYGPSILDTIDIIVSKEGASYKGEAIEGNDVYSKIDDRLKYYKDKEIKINDRYVNFKRLLEYTDNINTPKEKSIKRSLRAIFKDEGYKFIHVLQRLGYSIVKTESKSNVILKKFEKLEERSKKLVEIQDIILINLMATLGNLLYYDDEGLKVYHEESQERTRREKANIESLSDNLKFIDQRQLEEIMENSTKSRLPSYVNKEELYKNFEIVDDLTEVLYGEKVLTLYKNLCDIFNIEEEMEDENTIWKFLELNKEVEIDRESKIIKALSIKTIKREYRYYLKGKGYEIEIM